MKTTFEFSDNVLGIILEQRMDTEHLKQIQQMLQEKIDKHNEVRVYLEDKNNDGITLTAALKDLAFEMSRKTALKKIAVVTDARFFKLVSEIKEQLLDTEVESFGKENRMTAMNWVME